MKNSQAAKQFAIRNSRKLELLYGAMSFKVHQGIKAQRSFTDDDMVLSIFKKTLVSLRVSQKAKGTHAKVLIGKGLRLLQLVRYFCLAVLADSNGNKLNRLAKSNIVPFSRKTVEQSNLICLVDG